jgi:hypothetical protein
MDTNPDHQKQERMHCFFEKFGQDHPYALHLLQGHLLIEELLEEIVLSACLDRDTAREARLTFFNKFKLAQAIDGVGSKVWPCLDKLNSARNELAHGRDIFHLERKIDGFVDCVRNNFQSVTWRDLREDNLAIGVVIVHGALSRIAAERVHA